MYLSGPPGAVGYFLVYFPDPARDAVYFPVYFSKYFPAMAKTYFGFVGVFLNFQGLLGLWLVSDITNLAIKRGRSATPWAESRRTL